MRLAVKALFTISFIYSAFNIVNFLGMYFSESMSRRVAYLNLILIIAGTVLCFKDKTRDKFPPLLVLWYLFFISYYGIGMIANVIHGYEAPYLKTLVPIFYFVGFSVFLSSPDNRIYFKNLVIFSFIVANILLIYFQYINFTLNNLQGIADYSLERGGGVYGDANNAAVVCLLSIIFIEHYIKTEKILYKFLKFCAIAIALYALFLTFSKTGFVVLFLISALVFHRYITVGRILIIVFAAPLALYFIIQSALNSPHLSTVQKTRIVDVANILTLNTSEVSLSRRDVLIERLYGFIAENPILGNGVYFSTEMLGHNTILGVWADAGIFVFILFLILLASYLFRTLKVKNVDTRYFVLAILIVLYIFMTTLQTIINQGYLLAIIVFISFTLVVPKSTFEMNNSKIEEYT